MTERAGGPWLVDVLPVGDDVDMLSYRLRLHAPFTRTFVIWEMPVMYSGRRKPLHAHRLLLPDGHVAAELASDGVLGVTAAIRRVRTRLGSVALPDVVLVNVSEAASRTRTRSL